MQSYSSSACILRSPANLNRYCSISSSFSSSTSIKSYPIGTIPPTVPESTTSAAAASASTAAAAAASSSSAVGAKAETEIAQHVLLQVPKCACVFSCLPRLTSLVLRVWTEGTTDEGDAKGTHGTVPHESLLDFPIIHSIRIFRKLNFIPHPQTSFFAPSFSSMVWCWVYSLSVN